jgi:Xaa-Pro aminopeptidase
MLTSSARTDRLARARGALADAGGDWLLVPASSDLRWLTGAKARVTERLIALALPREGEPFLIAPRLEAAPLESELDGLPILIWDEQDDPLARLIERAGLGASSTVLIADGMRVPQVLRLAETSRCRAAGDVLASLRAVKEPAELEAMARAAQHADQIVEEAADRAQPGMTERDLARFVLQRFEELGDTDPWVIVASGPNSASPHHESSDRPIAMDEVLLIDLGAFTDGYGSDMTRTYFLGEPPRQVLRTWELVHRALEAGVAAVRAGRPAESVDVAARSVIDDAGLGASFTHRTGHGLGLEVHEAPWIVGGNRTLLAAGNVHSVEPGIYLPGRYGVRLEDIVVVEEQGARRLNAAPLDLRPPRKRA